MVRDHQPGQAVRRRDFYALAFARAPAIVDPQVAAVDPAEPLQRTTVAGVEQFIDPVPMLSAEPRTKDVVPLRIKQIKAASGIKSVG